MDYQSKVYVDVFYIINLLFEIQSENRELKISNKTFDCVQLTPTYNRNL